VFWKGSELIEVRLAVFWKFETGFEVPFTEIGVWLVTWL